MKHVAEEIMMFQAVLGVLSTARRQNMRKNWFICFSKVKKK